MSDGHHSGQSHLDEALSHKPHLEDAALRVIKHVAEHLPEHVDPATAIEDAKKHLARDIIAGDFEQNIQHWQSAQSAKGAEHLPKDWAIESASTVEAVHIERDFDTPQR